MSMWVVRKRNYCTLLQEKGRGNERLPRGNGWLTMHIMEALVRIPLVILMITFTFNHIRKHGTETSTAFKSHSHLTWLIRKPYTSSKSCVFVSSETEWWLIVQCYMLEEQTLICLMKHGGVYHLTVRSDCTSLRGPKRCWPWWHLICDKLFAPHMKASCPRPTEQFHSIEIHFHITGDVKPFWELL